jgi:predicted DNA-binding transcriptional regulator AlpA
MTEAMRGSFANGKADTGNTHSGRRLLREKQAREKLGGIGVTKFVQLRKETDFPRAIVVGPRCLAWDAAEIDAWIASRPRVRMGKGVAA